MNWTTKLIAIAGLTISSLTANVQNEYEDVTFQRETSEEVIQKIHDTTWRLIVMGRNNMEAHVVSIEHGEDVQAYLQLPVKDKCELEEGSLTKVNCSIELQYFHMPQIRIENETQVFGQRVFFNGRFAGHTHVNRVGYAYGLNWQSIYHRGQDKFTINWGPKQVSEQVNFNELHDVQSVNIDNQKIREFFQESVSRMNYVHANIDNMNLVSLESETEAVFEMDIFWRDIMHFGSYNTDETNLKMKVTLDPSGLPVHWEIIESGNLAHVGHMTGDKVPTPPRKMGDKWFPDFR